MLSVMFAVLIAVVSLVIGLIGKKFAVKLPSVMIVGHLKHICMFVMVDGVFFAKRMLITIINVIL